jgi:hypothetical protein
MTHDEFVEWIIKKAGGGIYRSEILNQRPVDMTLAGAARAIATAKHRGMYSVPDMRTLAGDTWYQRDGDQG